MDVQAWILITTWRLLLLLRFDSSWRQASYHTLPMWSRYSDDNVPSNLPTSSGVGCCLSLARVTRQHIQSIAQSRNTLPLKPFHPLALVEIPDPSRCVVWRMCAKRWTLWCVHGVQILRPAGPSGWMDSGTPPYFGARRKGPSTSQDPKCNSWHHGLASPMPGQGV